MPFLVTRLRRWFAAGAILMVLIVAGMYVSARWRRAREVVREIPKKLDLNIEQTADRFSISKSEAGRTLFTVSAAKVVQFKQGGRAALHDVRIVVYGKDSSRFDRITGDDFEYDPASGNVTAGGPVEIDLEGNPQGLLKPDQTAPAEMKNPIHIKTRGLVFNRNTGDASASGELEFQTTQASGSAVGITYVAKTRTLSLLSAVMIDLSPQQAHLNAERAVITREPRQVVLSRPRIVREQQKLRSDRATLFLREDNTVDHILAEGDVESELHGRSDARASANQAEFLLTGKQNLLTTATLSGNVRMAAQGAQPAEASAGRVTLRFGAKQLLRTVHAEGGVQLVQEKAAGVAGVVPVSAGSSSTSQTTNPEAQRVEMTAPVMDFVVKGGRLLERAETSGPPQIVITQSGAQQKTVVTAGKFTASFTNRNHLAGLRGEPEARIVSSAPSQTDRVSTSESLDVAFRPAGGITSIVQQGNVAYVDGARKAWGQRATYTAADQLLVLTGSPRVVDAGMTTTAQTIRIRRATGDATGEGDVKSTFSDLKGQPDGGLLAASDPVHVTSRAVVVHRSPAVAVYTGNARLWQNANIVEAPSLTFDREHRSLVAEKTGNQSVSTVLVQIDKNGKATPVTITAARLTYNDADRKIVFDGGVATKGADATVTAQKMDVFLVARNKTKAAADPGTPGQLDRIVAQGNIVITQPARRATGDRLEYLAADEKFVLTGGPPSIFDAEHGKITGDSLTFFRRDDRVLVEGRETSPTVTRTRVAR
jgi:lipopolysaccharide export system protein LptA